MATLGFGELMTLAFVRGGAHHRRRRRVHAASRSRPSARVEFRRGLVAVLAGLGRRRASPCWWPHNMTSLRPGRAMRALHGSELGAQACGVDIVGVKVRTFVVSALLAGLAGALYAGVVGFISPSVFTLTASITFLAMAVIGGTGSLAGPVVAAVAAHARAVPRRAHPRHAARDGADHPVVPGGHLRPRDRPRRDLRAAAGSPALWQAPRRGEARRREPAAGAQRHQALRRAHGRRRRLVRRLRGHHQGAHRPQRRRQVHAVQRADRVRPARRGLGALRRRRAGRPQPARRGAARAWRAPSRTRSSSTR